MAKPHSNRAYFYLAPALIAMTLTAVIPLAMVVNYSVQDSFAGDQYFWVGSRWFEQILTSRDSLWSLGLSFAFSFTVLLIEIPLGLFIALRLPARGKLSSLYIILMALPLLTPWLVVGYVWSLLVNQQAGLLGAGLSVLGFTYDMNNPAVIWLTLALMDAWHWTSFVVLLCFAGLRAIPNDYYQAAQIDGASKWAVFRHIQLPRLRLVLLIAVLLRFMDSFMIFTEAYVLTRGPGPVSTFLSHELVQTALIQFDLGEGGAMAVIYFVIILCISWAFFSIIVPRAPLSTEGALGR